MESSPNQIWQQVANLPVRKGLPSSSLGLSARNRVMDKKIKFTKITKEVRDGEVYITKEIKEGKEAEKEIGKFSKKVMKNMKGLDRSISKLVGENFWDLMQ